MNGSRRLALLLSVDPRSRRPPRLLRVDNGSRRRPRLFHVEKHLAGGLNRLLSIKKYPTTGSLVSIDGAWPRLFHVENHLAGVLNRLLSIRKYPTAGSLISIDGANDGGHLSGYLISPEQVGYERSDPPLAVDSVPTPP
ncbi:hypothetical protein PAHAL_4G268500 [Panicum hallii]|uniref:Uncharacterized protein n=1 Tax=Panicum hallii TaxID=206008 RepID=A0A2T8JE39_9POAL|nr:hypothetical protein PAHAL_4G268500 [Panicum hallii]